MPAFWATMAHPLSLPVLTMNASTSCETRDGKAQQRSRQ